MKKVEVEVGDVIRMGDVEVKVCAREWTRTKKGKDVLTGFYVEKNKKVILLSNLHTKPDE